VTLVYCSTSLAALAAACLMLSACAAKQLHYRITRINGVPSIAPPGYQDRTPPPDVRVRIPGVGARGADAANCNLSLKEFDLKAGGGKARQVSMTTRLNVLFPDGAYDEVARQAFEQFRIALEKLEQKGCLARGASLRVADRAAEAWPMPFQDVVYYRDGYDPHRGYVELRPGMRILQQAAPAKQNPDAKYKTQQVAYTVLAASDGQGLTFSKANTGDPSGWALDLHGKQSPQYRLFLRILFIHQPSPAPERNSVLVGAGTLEQLHQATVKLAEDADATCQGKLTKVPPACTVFPQRVTAGPEIPVTLNGKPAFLPVTYTLHDVLRRQKGLTPQQFLSKLEVQRLYAGKYYKVVFNQSDLAVIGLPLVSGDKVRW